jgi:hypothetical protein
MPLTEIDVFSAFLERRRSESADPPCAISRSVFALSCF